MTDPRLDLVSQLAPVLDVVARAPLADCHDQEAAARLRSQLEAALPTAGPVATEIGATLRRGLEQGWLCDRGEPKARFSRVAKASEDTHDLSIDIVALDGPALRHGHPRGEITLGFPIDPTATDSRFDGHEAGWVVMPVASVHTPTVTGSPMLLLYFLPEGAMDWSPAA
ncbi:MAG: DUF4863 family protein [Myxococcota bacterium]